MNEERLSYKPATIYDLISVLTDVEKSKQDLQLALLEAFSNRVKIEKGVSYDCIYKAHMIAALTKEYSEQIRKDTEDKKEGN